MTPVQVGIIGSRFQAECHASSIAMIATEMEVRAVASPSGNHAEAFAQRHGIPEHYTDYRELLPLLGLSDL